MLASSPDPEILAVFRSESRARVERMVQTLLAIEAQSAPDDAIDSLFRDAHSVKGAAGMLGLTRVRELAHAIEETLADAREAGQLPRELTDPLLRATDELGAAVEADDGGSAEVGTDGPGSGSGSVSEVSRLPSEGTTESGPTQTAAHHRREIRTSAEKVDRLIDAVGEAVLQSRRLDHLLNVADQRDDRVDEELGRRDSLLEELQDAVIQLRTLPLESVTTGFVRAVRDLAAGRGLDVEFSIRGADTQLDRVILDGIVETITHLLRNAVAHGIEPPDERIRNGKSARARIELSAEQRGDQIAIAVSDDGRGVSPELLSAAGQGRSLVDVLTEAGFSTAGEVTDVSGRGVGLDAVKAHIESLGGGLEIESDPGQGTTVSMLIPLTLALQRVLLFRRGETMFGVPLNSVEEVLAVHERLSLGGREAIELRGGAVHLADVATILNAQMPALQDRPHAVILASSGRRIALACDRIFDEEAVLVKSLGALLRNVGGYLGATILSDGRIALILDPASLTRATVDAPSRNGSGSSREAAKVLVVDDQFTVRELQRSILEAGGYRVDTASDGRDALAKLRDDPEIALVVTDVDMPEMDGIDLLKTIRADAARSALPVIVVSARGTQEDRQRGVEAGGDAYIVKGEFDQQTLLDTVQRLVTQ